MDNSKLLTQMLTDNAPEPDTDWVAWHSGRVLSPHELHVELEAIETEMRGWVDTVVMVAVAVGICLVAAPFVSWMASH